MPQIAQYIIESSLCLLAFLGFYWFILRPQKLFGFQRIYLMTMACLGLIIPGVNLDFEIIEKLVFGQTEEFHISVAESWKERTPDFQLNSGNVLLLIYFLGVTLVGFRRVDEVWKLFGKYEKQRKVIIPESQALHFKHPFPANSFFAYTFWNNYQPSDYQVSIIKRSSFKIREWHAWEVGLMELLIIANWFNPIFYWYKNQLNKTHQQLIDQFISQENIDYGNPIKDGAEIPQKQPISIEAIQKNQRRKWLLVLRNSIFIGVILIGSIGLFSFNLIEKTAFQKPLNQTATTLNKLGGFVFYEYQKPKPPIKKIVWGETEMLLEKVASPNGFTGSVEIELEDLEKMMDAEIQVFSGNQKLDLEQMDVVLDISNERGHLWFPNVKNGDIKLEHHRYGEMRDKIMRGDIISISGKADDHFLASLTFKVNDPLEIYRPKIKVPSISKKSPKFGFQIIPQKSKKTLIRIDTSNTETKHILDLYTDKNRYQVVHIPNFKTNMRLLADTEDLFVKEDLTEEYLSIARFDRYFLPEFHDFQHKEVRLNWGEMMAAPSSQNYNLDDFKKSRNQLLGLTIDSSSIEIVDFRLTIFEEENEPTAYHLDGISNKAILKILKKLPPKTSLYFDEIIIKTDTIFQYFPIKFVFNIGDFKDKFDLKIERSDSATIKKSRREEQLIEFKNYPMSELIAILTGDERMEFENTEKEPYLDIYFKSDFLDPKRGEDLILKNLRQQYYYSSSLRYETRKIWVIPPPENTKKLDSLEYFYHIAPNLEKVIDYNKKQHLETLAPGFFDELANVIENTFNITVFNESGLKKAYGLGLDLSSFDNLKQQLKEDYGIKLMEEERVVKMVKVVY